MHIKPSDIGPFFLLGNTKTTVRPEYVLNTIFSPTLRRPLAWECCSDDIFLLQVSLHTYLQAQQRLVWLALGLTSGQARSDSLFFTLTFGKPQGIGQ